MKKKSAKTGIEALIILLGVLILVIAYVFGVTKLNNKTDALKSENSLLSTKVTAYESIFNNMGTYSESTKTMKAEKENFYGKFRYNLSTVDRIMYATNVEGENKGSLVLSYLNLGDASEDYFVATGETNPLLAAAGIPTPEVTDDGISLYKYPMDFGFEVTYAGFKELIDYLNNVGGAKTVESLSLAFNSSTGILSGSMSLQQYVLAGTGNESTPIVIPFIPVGIDNIFGTVDVAALPTLEPVADSEEAGE